MNKPSAINWAQVDALTDETIGTSDIPPLTQSFFARATLRIPKQPIVNCGRNITGSEVDYGNHCNVLWNYRFDVLLR